MTLHYPKSNLVFFFALLFISFRTTAQVERNGTSNDNNLLTTVNGVLANYGLSSQCWDATNSYPIPYN